MPQATSPAVFVDPSVLRCAYCGKPVEFEKRAPQAAGFSFSTQIWCTNPACCACNVVGEVPITSLPGSKHRTRPKPAPTQES